MSPFAMADPPRNAALSVAAFAGMPVVRTGRGNTGGMASATGRGPVPSVSGRKGRHRRAVARYQVLFDTH